MLDLDAPHGNIGHQSPTHANPDPERNHANLRRKQRATIRKGLQAGLTPEIDATVDRLHAVYAASVHRLGTPTVGRW